MADGPDPALTEAIDSLRDTLSRLPDAVAGALGNQAARMIPAVPGGPAAGSSSAALKARRPSRPHPRPPTRRQRPSPARRSHPASSVTSDRPRRPSGRTEAADILGVRHVRRELYRRVDRRGHADRPGRLIGDVRRHDAARPACWQADGASTAAFVGNRPAGSSFDMAGGSSIEATPLDEGLEGGLIPPRGEPMHELAVVEAGGRTPRSDHTQRGAGRGMRRPATDRRAARRPRCTSGCAGPRGRGPGRPPRPGGRRARRRTRPGRRS